MARKKVKLAWIQNDSARRATFNKRRKGLMKKVRELSTLCDVKACAIVYNPYDSTPEVWPPDNQQVMCVLERFRSMPAMEQTKKMLNQERFLRDRIRKLGDQLRKMERDNREAELTSLMHQCIAGRTLQDLSADVVANLGWLLQLKLKLVQQKIEGLLAATAAAAAAAATNEMPTIPVGHQGYLNHYGAPATSPAEMGNFDPAVEVLRRSTEMFVYSPQYLSPVDDVGALPHYVGHLPPSYPADSNQSWLDNYF